jgi:hypothetical protein
VAADPRPPKGAILIGSAGNHQSAYTLLISTECNTRECIKSHAKPSILHSRHAPTSTNHNPLLPPFPIINATFNTNYFCTFH